MLNFSFVRTYVRDPALILNLVSHKGDGWLVLVSLLQQQRAKRLFSSLASSHCSQVVTIQRLHRSARSALARSCFVVVSLPQHHTEPSPVGWSSSPSYGRGDGWGGRPEGSNHGREGHKRWGAGEGDVAVLRVEVRTRAVCLFREKNELGFHHVVGKHGWVDMWL